MKDYSKYNKCHIELGYDWVFNSIINPTDYRYIYWRIRPSEMTWWDRIFHNPWRLFSGVIVDELNEVYSPKTFKEQLSHIKTYEQAVNYQNEQYRIVEEKKLEKIATGEYWPDDLND